jgi:hypothetical protein
VPVDALDHRHRCPRHAGDQEHVHAGHEHLADPEVAERVDRGARASPDPSASGPGISSTARGEGHQMDFVPGLTAKTTTLAA